MCAAEVWYGVAWTVVTLEIQTTGLQHTRKETGTEPNSNVLLVGMFQGQWACERKRNWSGAFVTNLERVDLKEVEVMPEHLERFVGMVFAAGSL